MKSFLIAAVLALASPALSHNYNLTLDTKYDHGAESLKSFACANGEYGLLTDGYTTLGSVPGFPDIGGAPVIKSNDLQYCGTCWELTYIDKHGHSMSLNMTAIDIGDATSHGFTISSEGMHAITDSKNTKSVVITAVKKQDKPCHL